jgi:putative restriction endonuclease
MYLALMEPGSYLDFATCVPFNDPEGPIERGLLNDRGRLSGRAQSAVRPISPDDFDRIIESGLQDRDAKLPRVGPQDQVPGFADAPAGFDHDGPRHRVQHLTTRIVRDRVFRKIVLHAYDERCAITGLKLINGGGRAEVDAAHIRPVQSDGPDIVNNGIALSGTAHWMFDRGLIGVSDDLDILVSRHVNDIDSVRSFINKSGRICAPRRGADRPHPQFLAWHRANCFKN